MNPRDEWQLAITVIAGVLLVWAFFIYEVASASHAVYPHDATFFNFGVTERIEPENGWVYIRWNGDDLKIAADWWRQTTGGIPYGRKGT